MPQIFALLLTVLLFVSPTFAAAPEDAHQHPSCAYCGMDRAKFAHSRILISYEDGTEVGTCSLRCAAVELALDIDRMPTKIQVGDYNSHELIDAESAFWVLGGKVKGVMTSRGKWAFATEAAANAFIAENGGERIPFEEAIKAAYVDMYQDTRMIRKNRKMKMQNKS